MTLANSTTGLTDGQMQASIQLFDWLTGPTRWSMLAAGLELQLFDHLREPITSQVLARDAGLCEASLVPWLRGLAAMGIIESRAQRWVLSAGMAPFLVSSGASSLVLTLQHLAKLRHGSTDDMVDCLRDGPQQQRAPAFNRATFWQQAAQQLNAFHRALAAPLYAELLVSLPCWPYRRSMLDVGAGSDGLARRLLNTHPDLTVTLFDLPECIKQTPNQYPYSSRLFHRAGDYNQDALGEGYDLIWCAMALYYADDLVQLCQRLRQALHPDGWLVSLHEGLSNQRTQPEQQVTSRTWPAMRGADFSFNAGEIAEAMTVAGFVRISRRQVAMPWGAMELTIGKAE